MLTRFKILITVIFLALVITGCFSESFQVENEDINGVWCDANKYAWCISNPNNKLSLVSRIFSWGSAKSANSGIMEFDVNSAPYPLFFDAGLANFRIKSIQKLTSTSLSVIVYRYSDVNDPNTYWEYSIILHFIDRDTMWIESEYYKNKGNRYGKKALWHKISGPPRIQPLSGVINDTRVRIRTKPDLKSDTWGFLNTGDRVTIIDKSEKQQKIGEVEAYWYKVDAEVYPDGWVFGAFINIE